MKLFKSLVLIPLFLSTAFFAGCGPERSSEDLRKEERDENEKLSRQELLDQAEARRPQIEIWAGCYRGVYYNGKKIEVVVSLREWFELVEPGPNMDPVEMPILLGSLKSFGASDDYAVPLTEFKSNGDATLIELRKPNTQKTYLNLRINRDRAHFGYYETEIMNAKEILLEPINEKHCVSRP